MFASHSAQANLTASETYVGSQECQQCHQAEFENWQQSDHFKAMAEPNADTVLGDFTDVTVEFHNIKTRFFIKNNDYYIDTIGKKGIRKTYKVDYTFGHYPLQQYLLKTEKGNIQAFNIAWDSRKKSEGGQRWFHLQPDENITPDHAFFWDGYFQNWNTRCAECHSTNVEKNFKVEDLSYHTTFSEINVGCEACHGPGKQHITNMKDGKTSKSELALAFVKQPKLSWEFVENDPIANPIGEKSETHIDMCGGCHSRRLPISDIKTGKPYHEQYRLELLGENLYFPDGQIQDEVFVLGSFLQSKMHQAGVTCQNCHEPHSSKLIAEGNALCNQCHLPTEFDTPKHYNHAKESEAAQCVSCHMPTRTYMGVDDRRDHGFKVPHPDVSDKETPNACTNCHQDKDNGWASKNINNWLTSHNKPKQTEAKWITANKKARSLDALANAKVAATASDETLPPIIRATLYQQLSNYPSRISVQGAQFGLLDKSPMIRRAAVASLTSLPADMRWQILEPMLKDTNASVRFEVASALSDVMTQLPAQAQQQIKPLIGIYKKGLELSAESPSSQVALANLASRQGDWKQAEQHYKIALKISPNYIPAILNLADYYRSQNKTDLELKHIQHALKVMPDSSAVQHTYGLYLIRQQKYNEAVSYLKEAAELADAQPRYAYVYAVALDSVKQTHRAIQALQNADKRWPNQYELLATQVLFLEKLGRTNDILRPLSKLSMIAPSSPQVQQWVQKYARQ
ncbi:hypothetical protein XM47_10025 [Catenovulum maritimum]|uniref:Cytochrome c-552/4 domain-containing protein n=1 Tax=Catenovulum maritimum TaxID=1513271 RepID=A0A0J8JLE7_9ALTE|nr:hypothetical protein XM47_10025 [Catenovulum maritimum]